MIALFPPGRSRDPTSGGLGSGTILILDSIEWAGPEMASQPTQQALSADQAPFVRIRGWAGGRGSWRIHLAWIGSILAISALLTCVYSTLRQRRSPGADELWTQAQADLRGRRFEQAEESVARLARL